MAIKVLRISVVAAVCGCFLFFFVLIPRNLRDISATASAFGLGTTSFLSLVKIFNFHLSKRKFYDLMLEIEIYGHEGKLRS
jgi:Sec-independent protein secretion pathway component TatC